MRNQAPCLNCQKRDYPSCYNVCEEYKEFKADRAKRNEYLREIGRDLDKYERSHTDLARRKNKKRRMV